MAMTPLKQECAGQEARALPASLASRRLTKARCLQGGPSRAVRPCVRWGQRWLTPRAVLCRTWSPWQLSAYCLLVVALPGGDQGPS